MKISRLFGLLTRLKEDARFKTPSSKDLSEDYIGHTHKAQYLKVATEEAGVSEVQTFNVILIPPCRWI